MIPEACPGAGGPGRPAAGRFRASAGYCVAVDGNGGALVYQQAGWSNLPIAHAPLLLIGTGLQLLLVLIGFADVPVSGLSWEIGAYMALIASAVAAGPLAVPAIRAWQGGR